MKSLILKILMIFLVVIILVSIVFQIYLKFTNNYETYIISISKIERKCDASGIIFKDEVVLDFGNETIIKNLHKDGTRVGIDSKIAQIYKTKEDALKYEQISILEEELEDLKKSRDDKLMKNLDFVGLDRQINTSYDKLLEDINERKISNINEDKRKLTSYLNTKDVIVNKKTDFEKSILRISDEIENIQKTMNMPKKIVSKHSGYFVGSVDGFEETCSIKSVDDLNLEEFREFSKKISNKKQIDQKKVKIITSPKILFKAIVPTKKIVNRNINRKFKIKFKETGQEVEGYLQDIILKYDQEYGIAIFEIYDMTEKLASLRKSDAEIVFEELYGFKIPKEAVKVNEKNETGVYVADLAKMKFKNINIVFEDENFVICSRDPKDISLSSKYIKNFDRVILKGKNLYDNKRI